MELTIAFNKTDKIPIYIQLYEYIKKEIITGQLETNTKLPSIRELSSYLKISRTTIEATYHQLYVEGYIMSKPKVGYFVNTIENNTFDNKRISNTYKGKNQQQTISKIVEYDFRNDSIDKESFDFSLWRKYLNKALITYSERFLTYGSYQGEYELRKEIAKYVHQSRGVICSPEQIIVGSGVQSLLNILCGILKPSYNEIGFENPGFKQGRHIFRDRNFNIIPISLENDGINIKVLSESKARLVYVSPSHQFPMGSIMSINKRIQLLNWAHENDALIIEDDYDSELRYFGKPIPSLQGLGEGNHVIYLGTFSKILLPSIRISYMILPEKIMTEYEEKMVQYNQTSSKIEQLALSLFIKEGMLEKQIRKLRKIYARKNQMLIEAIEQIMQDNVNIIGKETGLHILLEIKNSNSPEEIVFLSEKVGVKVIPISNYYINSEKNKYPLVLLSYGGISLEEIRPAIELLNQVWFEGR